MVNNETLKALREPLSESLISWRVGYMDEGKTMGQALPYIDNRIVQNRLDDVVGPSNWKNRYHEVVVGPKLVAVRCVIAICIDGQWIEKEDAAHLDDSQGSSRELAIKGVYSDAMKRAAVQWGIGRYLYDYQAPWVALDDDRRLAEIPKLPSCMLPAEEAAVRAQEEQEAQRTAAKPAARAEPVKAVAEAEKPAPKAEAVPVAQAPVAAPEPAPAPAPAQEEPATSVEAEVLRPRAPEAEAAPVAQEPVAEPAKAPAAATPAAPAPAPAPAAPAASADDVLASMPEQQRRLVEDLLDKIKKGSSVRMIRSYVTGPKGQEKLHAEARQFLLAKLDEAEAATGA